MQCRDSTFFFGVSMPSDRQARSLEYKCTPQMWLLISDLVMFNGLVVKVSPHGSNLREKGQNISGPLSFPREWTTPARTCEILHCMC